MIYGRVNRCSVGPGTRSPREDRAAEEEEEERPSLSGSSLPRATGFAYSPLRLTRWRIYIMHPMLGDGSWRKCNGNISPLARDSRPIRWLLLGRVGGWWCTYAQDRTLVSYIYTYTPFLLAFSTETRSRSGEIARANLHPWNPWRGPCASLPLNLARANPLFQRGIDVRIVYEAYEEREGGRYIQVAIGWWTRSYSP